MKSRSTEKRRRSPRWIAVRAGRVRSKVAHVTSRSIPSRPPSTRVPGGMVVSTSSRNGTPRIDRSFFSIE